MGRQNLDLHNIDCVQNQLHCTCPSSVLCQPCQLLLQADCTYITMHYGYCTLPHSFTVIQYIHMQAGEAGQFQIVLNCTNFTSPQLKTINLTESACGLVCLLISVIILEALLYCKAYKTPLQRLFLCLMVTTILQEAGLATTVEHQFQYRGQETVCKVIGFSNQCTGTMIYLFTAQIAPFLLYMVYKQLNGDLLYRLVNHGTHTLTAKVIMV